MAKRTTTLSVRCDPETEAQLSAIAEARGLTLSTLVYEELHGLVERERLRYIKLRAAFEVNQDLHARAIEDR